MKAPVQEEDNAASDVEDLGVVWHCGEDLEGRETSCLINWSTGSGLLHDEMDANLEEGDFEDEVLGASSIAESKMLSNPIYNISPSP